MKTVLLIVAIVVLTGCADKKQYETSVLEQMKVDKDVTDYKINPEKMTECVVEKSSGKMNGLFRFDPERLIAYRNYSKMLDISKSSDVKKALDELRQSFGSAKNLADAHANYAESVMGCIEGFVTSSELKNEQK